VAFGATVGIPLNCSLNVNACQIRHAQKPRQNIRELNMQRFLISLLSFEQSGEFAYLFNEPKESSLQTPLRIPLKVSAANLLLQIP
jgi:hypothetical protein